MRYWYFPAMFLAVIAPLSTTFADVCAKGAECTAYLYRQDSTKAKKVLVAMIRTELSDEEGVTFEHWCELPAFKPLSSSSKAIFSVVKKREQGEIEQFQDACRATVGATLRLHTIEEEVEVEEPVDPEEELE